MTLIQKIRYWFFKKGLIGKGTVWGMRTTITLRGCDAKTIRSKKSIETYVKQLCELIDMKRYGKCNVINFGEDDRVAGFSMYQLIETSNIDGHFANATNTAYLHIFSCKDYDVNAAVEFSKGFFRPTGGVEISYRYE